jgi:hypothetical protein
MASFVVVENFNEEHEPVCCFANHKEVSVTLDRLPEIRSVKPADRSIEEYSHSRNLLLGGFCSQSIKSHLFTHEMCTCYCLAQDFLGREVEEISHQAEK